MVGKHRIVALAKAVSIFAVGHLLLLLAVALPVCGTPYVLVKKDIGFLGEGRKEKMDAYLPPESFKRPVPAIVLIHGGAWRMGDKADERERDFGSFLANNGYAVFSINYKLNEFHRDENGKWLGQTVAWPQNLYDCKSAIRYVRKHADFFGIDATRVGVMGSSAGGHLAMLVGATAGEEMFAGVGLYLEETDDVSCVVNFYGIADVTDSSRAPKFEGGIPDLPEGENPTLASPITWMGPSSPSILVVHGDEDEAVPVNASRSLISRLEEWGVEHTYVEVSGAGHSFAWVAAGTDLRSIVLEFLRENL
tara:strand:- start:8428 stop:9348 length:921 start_codon:yes stop_codon:yes gene_type:complete